MLEDKFKPGDLVRVYKERVDTTWPVVHYFEPTQILKVLKRNDPVYSRPGSYCVEYYSGFPVKRGLSQNVREADLFLANTKNNQYTKNKTEKEGGEEKMSESRYTLKELAAAGILEMESLEDILTQRAKEIIKKSGNETVISLADKMTGLGITVDDLETYKLVNNLIDQVAQRVGA